MLQETKEKLPLDAKLLSEAIIELNISARNISIYPDGHPSVDQSIDKAYDFLKKLFEIRDAITLAVARDTLIVDHYYLDRKNLVYREFALILFNLGIASVTFNSGITKDEIIHFHKIITSKREDVESSGGVEKLIEKRGIKYIKVSLIDYSSFQLSDGQNKNEVDENLRENLWETFVYGLIEGRIADSNEDLERLKEIPPETLALIVNKNLPAQPKQESYEKVITSYLRKTKDDRRSRGESFTRFLQFIDGLKPSLKKEFMSGTFNHLSVNPQMAEEILSQLSSEKLLQILQQINEQDALIPQSLKGLLGKFAKLNEIDINVPSDVSMGNFVSNDIIDDIQIDFDSLRLFTSDESQAYMAKDYQREIEMIVSTDASAGSTFKIQDKKSSFKEEFVDSYACGVIIELLNHKPLTENDFKNLSNKLINMADFFVEKGQYREIVQIIEALEHFSKEEDFDDLAKEALLKIRNEDFIGKLTDSFRVLGRKRRDTATILALKLGRIVISPLMDALIEETGLSNRKFLMTILTKIGSPVVEEAKQRLNDTKWYAIRNAILLIRECGKQEDAELVKCLCEHRNKKVQLEALKTLLHFSSPSAWTYLESLIKSDDPSLRRQVIALSGTYKIKESVPFLISLLKKRDFLEVGFHHKIPVVKALGSIGDPRAVEVFIDILNMKSFIFGMSLHKLKLMIFQSLANFPAHAAKPLIDLGFQLKNEKIRSLCQKLAQDNKNE
jgi:hypothetical protein